MQADLEGPSLFGSNVWDPNLDYEQLEALNIAGRSTCELGFEKVLTLWTPEDGILTLRKLPYAARLRYTVQTARYRTRRKTVYLRHGV